MRLFDAGLELWPYGSAGLWWVASTQKAGPGVVKTRWLSGSSRLDLLLFVPYREKLI